MKKQCTKPVEKRRVPGTGNRVHGGPRREPEPSIPASQPTKRVLPLQRHPRLHPPFLQPPTHEIVTLRKQSKWVLKGSNKYKDKNIYKYAL